MKLGLITVLFSGMPFEKMLDYVAQAGLECVELGTGNYPGDAHCNPGELLKSRTKLESFKDALGRRGLEISGLSCHGNPLHPNKSIAKKHHETMRQTVLLAEKLGVTRIIGFSGCPGGSDRDRYPNWVTCPWPEDFQEILKWQWEEKVIPYWRREAKFCANHGVKHICLEMHPGFVVYSPETLLKLRSAAGKAIGANFDPSHLFWQGIDPIKALRALKGAVYHVHAKDTLVYGVNSEINGVLDTKPYGDEYNRSWLFRTVGYGHGLDFWNDFVSTLRLIGYDYVLSIEHEDSLMSAEEGFLKAVGFLKNVLLRQKAGGMWWA
jgi:sugar phosphate isomerase/epimerase